MRKTVFALILILGIVFSAFGQASGPMDLVVLLDTSASMSDSYYETSDYLIGPFLKEFLRIGDTFHLVSFSGEPKLEISRLVEGEGDVQTIAGRLLLMYPLYPDSNIAGALSFAEKYAASLPGQRHRKIILISDGNGGSQAVQNAVNEASARLSRQGADLQYIKVPVTGTPPVSGRPQAPAPRPASRPDTAPQGQQQASAVTGSVGTRPSQQAAEQPGRQQQAPQPSSQQPQQQPAQSGQARQSEGSQPSGSAAGVPGAQAQGQSPAQQQAPQSPSQPSSQTPQQQAPQPSPQTQQPAQEGQARQPESSRPQDSQPSGNAVDVQPSETAQSGQPLPPETGEPSGIGTQPQQETAPSAPQEPRPAQPSREPSRPSSSGSGGIPDDIPLPLIIGLILLALLILALIIFFASRNLHSSPNRVMAQAASAPVDNRERLEAERQSRIQGAEMMSSYAERTKNSGAPPLSPPPQRRKPMPKDKPVNQNLDFDNGPPMLNLFVEDQNTAIGRRNIHAVKAGYTFSVGGGKSDFLIFLVPVPPHIADVTFDGRQCTLIPRKPQYFPDIGSQQVPNCIGKTIRVISDKNYELHIRIERYEDPLKALNKLLHSINVPG